MLTRGYWPGPVIVNTALGENRAEVLLTSEAEAASSVQNSSSSPSSTG